MSSIRDRLPTVLGLSLGLLFASWASADVVNEVRLVNGVATCVTREQPTTVTAASFSWPLVHEINAHINPNGATILLRATQQLETFPAAKAAFIRAAATWEQYILDPITVVIGVDFGPTRFGQAYPDRVLGSTDPVLTLTSYTLASIALKASASSANDAALYSTLPAVLDTDRGPAFTVVAPQAQLRALRLLAPSPLISDQIPTIGFNSAGAFDFDRFDGIAANQFDFESAALHEIGHVLAFSSMVGSTELTPTLPASSSILDIFRTRPGSTLATIASAQRVQSSGGEQSFFNGLWESKLSTGRPDGTGGDGHQPSHWKDDAQGDEHVGVMDPTLANGEVFFLMASDLVALDVTGYRIGYPPPPATTPVLVATATSPSSIDLTWTDGSTNQSEYRLLVYAYNRWQDVGGAAASRREASISGLSPDTLYYFAVIGSNAGGTKVSNTASARTQSVAALIPPAPPTNLTFDTRDATTVVLRWRHDGANVKGFRSYYSTDGVTFRSIGDLNPTWRWVTITKLETGFIYSFRLTAFGDGGESVASNTVSIPPFAAPKKRAARH